MTKLGLGRLVLVSVTNTTMTILSRILYHPLQRSRRSSGLLVGKMFDPNGYTYTHHNHNCNNTWIELWRYIATTLSHKVSPHPQGPPRTLSGCDGTQRLHHFHNCCPEDFWISVVGLQQSTLRARFTYPQPPYVFV